MKVGIQYLEAIPWTKGKPQHIWTGIFSVLLLVYLLVIVRVMTASKYAEDIT